MDPVFVIKYPYLERIAALRDGQGLHMRLINRWIKRLFSGGEEDGIRMNIRNRIRYVMLAAALCLLCLAPAAQAAVVSAGSEPGAALNLRAQPDAGAAVLGSFYTGTQAEVVADAGGGFAQVRIGAEYAYVSGYMASAYLAQEGSVQDASQTMRVCSPYGTPSVVLRDRPSDSYSVLAMLEVGEAVRVIGTAGDYRYVMLDDGGVGCLSVRELE